MRKEAKAFLVQEVKKNLENLQSLLPNETNPLIYPFGKYLIEYLSDPLFPNDFVVACEQAVFDLSIATNRHNNKKIDSILTGNPKIHYSILRMSIPEIAGAIFPAYFASDVKKILKEAKNNQN
jgi:hypothetical protein